MRLAYIWLANLKHGLIITLTGHSSEAVTTFKAHFRELVTSTLTEKDTMIDDEGVVVDIYESKMGKRKYNRGDSMDGVWIV
jgi:hypothetical protein